MRGHGVMQVMIKVEGIRSLLERLRAEEGAALRLY